MKKSTIIIGVCAISLIGILYSLPKVVVDAKAKDNGLEGQTTEAIAAEEGPSAHATTSLTDDQLKTVNSIKEALSTDNKEQKAITFLKLSDTFFKFQRFDSSAVYAEKAAEIFPSTENFLRAGDRYYEAFGFALNGGKAKHLGEKTREYYQKALDQDPTLLLAKANMAMTYVSTDTPMQGIMMLREVLDTDPTNEVALFNMGILSMNSNQYSKAVERFSQIVKNNPNNTKAKFYLGVSLIETGKKDEAKKVLAEVKKQEKDPAIQEAIKELEQRLGKSND